MGVALGLSPLEGGTKLGLAWSLSRNWLGQLLQTVVTLVYSLPLPPPVTPAATPLTWGKEGSSCNTKNHYHFLSACCVPGTS